MNIHNLIIIINHRSSTRDGSKRIINAEGTHYHRSSRKETEVGNDAEGTHLTLIKEGGYDIQTISMETVCEST